MENVGEESLWEDISNKGDVTWYDSRAKALLLLGSCLPMLSLGEVVSRARGTLSWLDLLSRRPETRFGDWPPGLICCARAAGESRVDISIPDRCQ